MSGQYFATILLYITRFKLRNITFNPDKATAALMVEREESHYPPPPFNLSLYKGIKSFRLPRSFVSFLLTHPVARDFLDWVMFCSPHMLRSTPSPPWPGSLALTCWTMELGKSHRIEKCR